MKAKRGQLTLFVLLGVLLVVGLGVFLYARSASVPKEEAVPADVAPIKVYVDQCLKSTAEDAVLFVALQGGYYIPPDNSFGFLNINIPYYLYEGNLSVPTKEMIEKELSLYVEDNLPLCADMASFKEKGYNITTENPEVKSTIGAKEVFFDVNFPITIKIEMQEQKISKFNADVKAEFIKMQSAIIDYLVYQVKEKSMFAMSDAMEISIQNNLKFEALLLENRTTIFSFIDESTKIKNRDFIFNFAIKYIPAEIVENAVNESVANPAENQTEETTGII